MSAVIQKILILPAIYQSAILDDLSIPPSERTIQKNEKRKRNAHSIHFGLCNKYGLE
jgi:hypothetical protein